MSGLDSKSLCLICQSGPGLKKTPTKTKKKTQKKERERLVDCFKPSILMRGGGGGGGEDGVGMLGHTK